jgi:hypothetical protein
MPNRIQGHDLTPAAKLVLLIRRQLLAAGYKPTPKQLVTETGLSRRTVFYALATLRGSANLAPSGSANGALKGANLAPYAHKAVVVYSVSVVLVVKEEGGEKKQLPPPGACAPGKETADGGQPLLPEIEAFLARQAPREPADVVVAEILDDLARKKYRLEDLRAFIESRAKHRTRSWKLREEVPPFVALRLREIHRDRLRRIQEGGWRVAWRRAEPGRVARVLSVEPETGRITFRFAGKMTPAYTARVAMRLGDRLVRPGEMIPAKPGAPENVAVETAEDLARWVFEAECQPLLDESAKPETRNSERNAETA